MLLSEKQTYPSGYGARLLSECALHAQVRTLPSAALLPPPSPRTASQEGFQHRASLAQSVERKALNLVVVGSSPTVGVCADVFQNGG